MGLAAEASTFAVERLPCSTTASITDLSADLTSMGLSCLTIHFTGGSWPLRLYIGHLVNHDDQQDHHQYGDHRPNPYPPAHPPVHPSICVVHHKAPFVALRPAHPWSSQIMGGSSSVSSFSRHRATANVPSGSS